MLFLWFASGIVMMYVEYPELTEEERLRSLPELGISSIEYGLDEIQPELAADHQISTIKLTSIVGRPTYELELRDPYGSVHNTRLFADSGEYLPAVTQETAKSAAVIYAENLELEAEPEYLDAIDMDQWTISGALRSHRPLHKVSLNDERGTILYISDLTGQVVLDTHRWERNWNWIGSTIHWIYPLQLRRHSALWADIVVWGSIAAIAAVFTGTIVGFLRLRIRRRYKHGRMTPYSGWQKWHHLFGIGCAAFIGMFLVSGLLSMSPFGLFENKTSPFPQVARYYSSGSIIEEDYLNGFETNLANLDHAIEQAQGAKPHIKELSWKAIGGVGVLTSYSENSRSTINLSRQELELHIVQTATQLLPDSQLLELETLDQFDNHYYSTHNRHRPLPALRAKFNDEEKTWYYIDKLTGEVLNRSTAVDRQRRWLYNGLHSLDFRFLLNHRPLWDLVILTLSALGIIFSSTAVVIGWKRLLKTKPPKFWRTKTPS